MAEVADYGAFLARKGQLDGGFGFEPRFLPGFLFDFQRALVERAVRMGRSAIFADCGLGKTPIELTWSQNVVEHMNDSLRVDRSMTFSEQEVAPAWL